MLRRLVLTAAASAAALSVLPLLPVTAHAAPSYPSAPGPTDRLTITVSDSGGDGEGTYVLKCHPTGGTHPAAAKACARLDEVTVYGTDPFAPVPSDRMCTMQYGGPATARITGTWQGRPVDATYNRGNGCEISRWDRMAPVLPHTS
ncbi:MULTISPECIES: SSI family serine proteinase inhibitor [unclassified Streptomyces]|uniref:SSI family serine proteinase inhibitor n=1 Tax=unclassified Streptomyces TaxID=2593676 RepID=UPI001CBDB812|nr:MULTISPECIES: SSI family serine proteinase inhibitor [unclassified Streptomyces]WPO72741.1 SSI family serine proteinase inhibitor [Streptomyces sp. KN37]